MNSVSVVILAASTLVLCACAGAGAGRISGTEPSASRALTSAPAPAAGYDWFYNQDDDTREASLSYGVADSDEVPLGLRCTAGGRNLTLSRPTAVGRPARITLESGGDMQTYTARSEDDPIHDGQFLTASAPLSDPVFKRFRRVGWLAVLDDGTRIMMTPHPASTSRVERFFAFCG